MQPGISAVQNLSQSSGIYQYIERCQGILITILVFQRLQNGCRQVRTTADGLCNDHVRLCILPQFVKGSFKSREIAAEAASAHFFRITTCAGQDRGIDQIRRLIVSHQACADLSFIHNFCKL